MNKRLRDLLSGLELSLRWQSRINYHLDLISGPFSRALAKPKCQHTLKSELMIIHSHSVFNTFITMKSCHPISYQHLHVIYVTVLYTLIPSAPSVLVTPTATADSSLYHVPQSL